MPDWIGDQMAGVRPEATRVFGRNAQIAVIRRGHPEGAGRKLAAVRGKTKPIPSSGSTWGSRTASPDSVVHREFVSMAP